MFDLYLPCLLSGIAHIQIQHTHTYKYCILAILYEENNKTEKKLILRVYYERTSSKLSDFHCISFIQITYFISNLHFKNRKAPLSLSYSSLSPKRSPNI